MKTDNVVYFKTRADWRQWLEDNFDKKDEVWFVFPKKTSNITSITYNDAVEEALCFGWIDSTVKSLDKENKIQRFTPRKAKSSYSQPNIERLRWLLENNLIQPSLIKEVKTIISKEFVFPFDIINAIKSDNIAWKNYKPLQEGYKRIRIAYIESARKRPEEFKKRLNNFIAKTKENKLIAGYGGVEKYY